MPSVLLTLNLKPQLFFHALALRHFLCSHVLQPGFSLHTFTGHSGQVTSLDFHPKKTDLLCSCDGSGEIRYWNATQLTCLRAIKVAYIPSTLQSFMYEFVQKESMDLVTQYFVQFCLLCTGW